MQRVEAVYAILRTGAYGKGRGRKMNFQLWPPHVPIQNSVLTYTHMIAFYYII